MKRTLYLLTFCILTFIFCSGFMGACGAGMGSLLGGAGTGDIHQEKADCAARGWHWNSDPGTAPYCHPINFNTLVYEEAADHEICLEHGNIWKKQFVPDQYGQYGQHSYKMDCQPNPRNNIRG